MSTNVPSTAETSHVHHCVGPLKVDASTSTDDNEALIVSLSSNGEFFMQEDGGLSQAKNGVSDDADMSEICDILQQGDEASCIVDEIFEASSDFAYDVCTRVGEFAMRIVEAFHINPQLMPHIIHDLSRRVLHEQKVLKSVTSSCERYIERASERQKKKQMKDEEMANLTSLLENLKLQLQDETHVVHKVGDQEEKQKY